MSIRHTFDVPPRTASPAGGELASVVGTPSDGDVVTWIAANNQYEPRAGSGGGAPAGYVYMPLVSIVDGIPQPVLDADGALIPTLYAL